MIRFSRLASFSLLGLCCLLLQGCQSVKKNLGMEREAPDEFAVTPSTQPLDMPPDFFVLPAPQPGCPRPQEQKAMQEQKEKLFKINTTHKGQSTGQKALLEKAGAEKSQADVRKKVDEESRIASIKDKPLLEKLGIKKPKPKGEALNPQEEAQQLQEKGIPRIPNVKTE